MIKLSFLAIVLAGGKSKRMGINKSLIKIDQMPMILHIMNSLKKAGCSNFIIQIKNKKQKDEIKDLISKFNIIWNYDDFDESNVIGGIYSALVLAKEKGWRYAQLVPIDTPYVSNKLFGILSKKISENYEVIIPKSENTADGLEPLLSYIKIQSLLDKIDNINSTKKKSLKSIFLQMNYKVINLEELKENNISNRDFTNINTPTDV